MSDMGCCRGRGQPRRWAHALADVVRPGGRLRIRGRKRFSVRKEREPTIDAQDLAVDELAARAGEESDRVGNLG